MQLIELKVNFNTVDNWFKELINNCRIFRSAKMNTEQMFDIKMHKTYEKLEHIESVNQNIDFAICQIIV